MSRGRHPSAVTYADLAIDRFRQWPLTACRADCPPGRALSLPDRQIVHLHRGDLAEVHLTRPVISRLTTTLAASGRVDILPGTAWVEVHLEADNDLFLLESLVSLAIQANDPTHPRDPIAYCPQAVPGSRRRTPLSRA
ncbi:luciferase family protein [Actinocorallia longicatena]|uniref:Luciferase domain-containing protein n=1 Tax=Actinocorallia longicatena TaxID=111803 RepID=A0ABP6QP64_9ACTN